MTIRQRFFYIVCFLLCLVAFALRAKEFFHSGFVYDLIETQYEWAKSSVDDGFISFWKNYRLGGIDYLPGAIYVISILQWLNTVFGNAGEGGFVFLLKLFNAVNDFVFAYFIFLIAKKLGKLTTNTSALLAITTLFLPSLWFISAVWGQFDTFPINLSIAMSYLLYSSFIEKNDKKALYAGGIFAAIIWFKLQGILLVPALFLLFISHKAWPQIKKFWLGFGGISFGMLIVPLLVNPIRLAFVIGQVLFRSNNVTNGAATFWPIVGMVKYGNDDWFTVLNITITASRFAYLVYILAMSYILIKLFGLKVQQLIAKPLKVIGNLQPISFTHFVLVSSLSSSIYFMFFTKMMSRYLHWGYLFGLVLLVLTWKSNIRGWLIASLACLEVGYFLNQIGVYGWWNTYPLWPRTLSQYGFISSYNLASWFNLFGLVLLFFTCAKYVQKASKDDR
jgi:hypothetical protein